MAQSFLQLAKSGFNRVPVVREIFADLDTPLSTFLKLAAQPYSYLLESVTGGENKGRYSIIGLPASKRIEIRDNQISIIEGDVIHQETTEDPLKFIEDYISQYRVYEPESLPRYNGGLVGYFGYETIGLIEPKLKKTDKPDPIDVPDILLMHSDEVVVFDNVSGKLSLIVHVDPAQTDAATHANNRLDALQAQLAQAIDTTTLSNHKPVELTEADFVSEFGEEAFKDAVKTCQQYITDGDAMQIVLSQRMSAPFTASPINFYRSLRSLNPSPYMYYLDLGGFHVVGASPEILVRVEEDTVTVRPIAGTRKRGRHEAHDKALEQELLNDPKEIAEHLMLIDLGRNDVGRIAETGTVNLTDKMVIERYSHVMHIVSNVEGKLKAGMGALDVLKATFPAGTVSGAPKIRAMEIIHELEPTKRGVYSGAVGYLGWNGALDVAIAIRTAVIKDNTLYVQAGGGLVYDSIPELEWKESNNKARAVIRAAQLAEAGL